QTRRVALNLATRVLTIGLATVLLGTGKRVEANPLTEIQLVTSMATTGQQQGSLAEQRKQDDLLKAARDAMRKGDFDRAQSLVEQAKQSNTPDGAQFSKFRDTPEKAQQDLTELKAMQA